MNEQKSGRSYRGIDAEDRQQKRREDLVQAGFELFGSRGYRATSVKLVCDHVGLTERYFYESFANREALLLEVYAQLGSELEERLIQVIEQEDAASHERLEQALSSFFQYIQEDRRRGRIMFLEIVGVSQQVDRNYQSVVRDQAATLAHPNLGIFPDDSTLTDEDRRVITIGLIGAITQIAAQWVLEDFATSKAVVVRNAFRICLATSRYLGG